MGALPWHPCSLAWVSPALGFKPGSFSHGYAVGSWKPLSPGQGWGVLPTIISVRQGFSLPLIDSSLDSLQLVAFLHRVSHQLFLP